MNRTKRHASAAIAALILLGSRLTAAAEPPAPEQCGPMPGTTPILTPAPGEGPTTITADQGTLSQGQYLVLEGDVLIERGNRTLIADKATYDKRNDTLEAQGDVHFTQDGLVITGDKAQVDLAANKASLTDAHYDIAAPLNARGGASRVRLSPNVIRLDKASYTTCAPGNNAWLLSAGKLKLDDKAGTGTASNVTLRVRGVPVAYVPYASFSLGRRKSGFLVPTFTVSETSGTEVGTPYYFNIAPNRDATVTPRWLSKRGGQALGEFRYLNATNHGEAHVEYLPDDRLAGRNRSLYAWRHSGNFNPRWSTDLEFINVSDDDYFCDLGSDLGTASQVFLERHLTTVYSGDGWQALGRLQDYQILDPALESPYQRAPQVAYDRGGVLREFDYRLHTEFVRFTGPGNLPTGGRVDIYPTFIYPVRRVSGFAISQVSVRYTHYSLDDETSTSRTVPTFSLDGGAYFEKEQKHYRQVLEPRAFYVLTPYRPQDSLPLFDTGLLEISYAQLFQENRYVGADRVGDKNQLTLALTHRLISIADGRETLRASIGQIRYFKDQQVVLPGETPFTAGSYRTIAELVGRLARQWTARGDMQWLSDDGHPERGSIRLNYGGQRLGTDLSLRYRSGEIYQGGVAALWRATSRWRFAGRWLYSLRDGRTFDTSFGAEYEACCWAVRATARRFITAPEGELNTTVGIQLELKGLTSIGRKLDENIVAPGVAGFVPNL